MNIIRFKRINTLILTSLFLCSCLLNSKLVVASGDEGKTLEQLMIEWEESGIDSNHTDAIAKIQDYINKNVEKDTFASLHIDREVNPLGIIVLSFTKEISSDMQEEIKLLVKEPAEVSFRDVKFTEEQLMEKQQEIDVQIFDKDVLKNEGITVYHTSTDIITNKVELGISPYNDKTIKIVENYFGNDMINVVQGDEVHLLDEKKSLSIQEEGKQKGFFTIILDWLAGLFT